MTAVPSSSPESETAAPLYAFDGSISYGVLKNYLSRSITYSLFDSSAYGIEKDVSAILEIGAKHIARAAGVWITGGFELGRAATYREIIELTHQTDPDVVFEACLFETTSRGVEQIDIPAFVFEAFGLPVEDRAFSYQAMLYPDKRYVDHWGKDQSVPDISQLETQMFMFWHAAFYIDAGFEGLHWGQVHLMGENDTDFACWTKVLDLTRRYAGEHARRHFVLNNAHTHGIHGTDGKLLFDFHSFPSRLTTPPGAQAHPPTAENPQEAILVQGSPDVIYGKSMGGLTHSGWSCDALPYTVELDNYGGIRDVESMNKPGIDFWPWGYDEISWFANQPKAYRASWLEYAYKQVQEFDDFGYLVMPGSRGITLYLEDTPDQPMTGMYYSLLTGDIDAYKLIWDSYAAPLK